MPIPADAVTIKVGVTATGLGGQVTTDWFRVTLDCPLEKVFGWWTKLRLGEGRGAMKANFILEVDGKDKFLAEEDTVESAGLTEGCLPHAIPRDSTPSPRQLRSPPPYSPERTR